MRDRQATKLTDKELVDTRLGRVVIRDHEIEVILAVLPQLLAKIDQSLKEHAEEEKEDARKGIVRPWSV